MRNDGKKAEEYCREAFKFMQENHRVTYVRLYDTTSTGATAYIPEQPGDFILVRDSRAFLIEVKSSDKKDSMRDFTLKGFVKPAQKLGAKLWVRAGATSLFIFISLNKKSFEIWDGRYVNQCMTEKVRLRGFPVAYGGVKDLLKHLLELT